MITLAVVYAAVAFFCAVVFINVFLEEYVSTWPIFTLLWPIGALVLFVLFLKTTWRATVTMIRHVLES